MVTCLRGARYDLVFFMALSFLAIFSDSSNGEKPHPDSLLQRIQEIRHEGSYQSALSLTRDLREVLSERSETRPWQLEDAENLTSTLELAVSLSPQQQRDLAEADRSTEVIEALCDSGKYEEARILAERQLEIRKNLLGDEHREFAETLSNVALIRWKQNQFAEAESLASEGLEILRKAVGPDHPAVAGCLNVLGLTIMAGGRPAEAEQLYRDALAMNRRLFGEEHPSIATNLHNLGAVRQEQGDVRGAEPFYRASLAMSRELIGKDDAAIASNLHALAFNLAAQGDVLSAEKLYREALDMRLRVLGEDHPDAAFTMVHLGGVLGDRDPEAAEALARKALPILIRAYGEAHWHVAWCQSLLHSLALQKGDYAKAERLARKRLETMREIFGESRHPFFHSLLDLALVLEKEGRIEEAERLYAEHVEKYHAIYGEDPALAATQLARLFYAKGEREKAEALLSRAANQYEADRLKLTTERTRSLVDHRSPYSLLAAVRLELGKTAEAWPAEEMRHGRILSELLLTSDRRSLTPSESLREKTLKERLTTLEGQLEALEKANQANPTNIVAQTIEQTRTRLLEAQAEWGSLREEIARRRSSTENQTYSLAEIQSALPESTALIGWIDERIDGDNLLSWGYAIRNTGPVHWERLEPRAADGIPLTAKARELQEKLRVAGSWLFRVSSEAGVRGNARTLWSERIAPLASHLEGAEHLVVIPSGSMLGVPVEALPDDAGVYIGERYAVSYAPSATIYAWLRDQSDRNADTSRRALLVGDPPFTEEQLAAMEEGRHGLLAATVGPMDKTVFRSALAGNEEALAQLPRLPKSRQEVARLGSIMPGSRILLGENASEEEIVLMSKSGKLREYDTFHFATHALVDDQQPEASALVLSRVHLPDPLEAALSESRMYDGLLTAKEILREWELDADLVTLSGCQTALGMETAGEGYIGLAHTFLQVGARSVVVSLWRVEDTATSLLMGRFYENLTGAYDDERGDHVGERMSKVEALREAKHWLRNYRNEEGEQPYRHPAYWSAFILIGNPE